MSPYELELFKAGLSLTVAVSALGATWWVGYRISAMWNLHQKRNEINLAALATFHSLYGEFKEVVRIWRVVKRPQKVSVSVPDGERWRLLVRACAIESRCEALVLRLTAERQLSLQNLTALGLFRQAIQTLRESIREDVDCPIGSRGEEYKLLNELAPEILHMASAVLARHAPTFDVAKYQLAGVVRVTSQNWKEKVASMKNVGPAASDEDA